MFATLKYIISVTDKPSNALRLGFFYARMRTFMIWRCSTPCIHYNGVCKSQECTLAAGSGHRFFMPTC